MGDWSSTLSCATAMEHMVSRKPAPVRPRPSPGDSWPGAPRPCEARGRPRLKRWGRSVPKEEIDAAESRTARGGSTMTAPDLAPFIERRQRFAQALGDGLAVIPGAREVVRNSDVHHEFRQDSDF